MLEYPLWFGLSEFAFWRDLKDFNAHARPWQLSLHGWVFTWPCSAGAAEALSLWPTLDPICLASSQAHKSLAAAAARFQLSTFHTFCGCDSCGLAVIVSVLASTIVTATATLPLPRPALLPGARHGHGKWAGSSQRPVQLSHFCFLFIWKGKGNGNESKASWSESKFLRLRPPLARLLHCDITGVAPT